MSDVATEGPPTSQVVHRRTLLDDRADRDLADRGFAVVDFWGADVAAELRRSYLALVPDQEPQLAVDYMRDDRELVRRMQGLLDGILDDGVRATFADHVIVQTTFVTKYPGPASNLFLHEDLTGVDEREHRAATIWAPLDPVGPTHDNGGLEVVAGSHRLARTWGGTGTPDLIRPHEATLRARLERPAVEPGRALIYDSRLLHASPANRTDRPRVAMICRVIPSEALPIHVRATGRRHRQVFRVDRDFFVDHHPHALHEAMPTGFPLLFEYDEEASLQEDVLADLTSGAEPSVVVPLDMELGPTDGGPLPAGELRVAPATQDVPVELLAVGTGSASVPPLVEVRSSHAHQVVAVRRAGAPIGALPPSLTPVALATPAGHDVDVVLLAAGSRSTLAATGGRAVDAAVFDGPQVAAGASIGDRIGNLDLGSSFRVAPASSALVWNDGPGLLTLVVGGASAAPVPSGPDDPPVRVRRHDAPA